MLKSDTCGQSDLVKEGCGLCFVSLTVLSVCELAVCVCEPCPLAFLKPLPA